MTELNVHGLIPRSLVNGPGERFVIHLQGCGRRCPGCINPDSHSSEPRTIMTVDELFDSVRAVNGIEGITFSGGEPFDQIDGCIEFMKRVKDETGLSILMYTGYTIEEIQRMPLGHAFLEHIDILVDGPYIQGLRCESGFLPSTNQRVLFLSDRYGPDDIDVPGEFEIHVHPDGRIVITGLPPEHWRNR
ncbi:MAG: radical SAM protein [Candidatus Dadabacteria bacterium]|nr:radical SAM protein [Candidatus Dadabacteria bacterium]